MKISFDHQLCLLFSVACMRKWPINQRKNNRPIRLHGPVFSANFGASGDGVFGKIIFGCHDKLFTNVLYQS